MIDEARESDQAEAHQAARRQAGAVQIAPGFCVEPSQGGWVRPQQATAGDGAHRSQHRGRDTVRHRLDTQARRRREAVADGARQHGRVVVADVEGSPQHRGELAVAGHCERAGLAVGVVVGTPRQLRCGGVVDLAGEDPVSGAGRQGCRASQHSAATQRHAMLHQAPDSAMPTGVKIKAEGIVHRNRCGCLAA